MTSTGYSLPRPSDSSTSSAARRVGWLWVLLSSLGVVAYAVLPYLTGSLQELSRSGEGLAPHFVTLPGWVQFALYVHIAGGGIALLLGPLQFWRWLRQHHARVHRTIGRSYLIAVAVGSVAGFTMAFFNEAGLIGTFGFSILAVLWFFTAFKGYRAIRSGHVDEHRAWMIRNFALTYAAVTLRLWLALLIAGQGVFATGQFDAGAAFTNAYVIVPFLCWVPNILVAELLIARWGLPSFIRSRRTAVEMRRARTATRS